MYSYGRPSFASLARLAAGSLFAAVLVLLVPAGTALAYNETTSTVPPISEANCSPCHQPWNGGSGILSGVGVHGGYTTVTKKCKQCHSVHTADAYGRKLLPGPTVADSCNTCHDGTGGQGVYGVLARRSVAVGAAHRVEATNVVPGGNAATGGDATMTLSAWSDGTLTCIDCHSVHASSVVASFTGDRQRGAAFNLPGYFSTKLLKQKPGGATTATLVYGSDWCLACHKGRNAIGPIHNHPVETSASASPAAAYWYGNVARLSVDTPTSIVATGEMGRTNRGYLMPYPRRPLQVGHDPICQQCHEDSRDVGSLDTTGTIGDAATFVGALDGTPTTGNPRFQTFPHETANANLLVETDDNLCTNCHPVGVLP